MPHTDQSGAIVAAMAAYGFFISLVALASIVLGIIVQWRIASKAGYNGALSLLMLVPFVNIVVLLVFAFSEWPIERELKARHSEPPWQPPPMKPPTTL